MAVRTTAAAVQLILETDLTEAQINAFITPASLWIDINLVGACSALTTALLTEIETWLAAHYCTARDARLLQTKLDDVSEKYQRHGEVSEYLKTAAGLDPCGVIQEKLIDGATKALWRVGIGYDSTLGDLP